MDCNAFLNESMFELLVKCCNYVYFRDFGSQNTEEKWCDDCRVSLQSIHGWIYALLAC